MSDEQNEINVYESRRFAKALSKLSDAHLSIVEDEIDRIIKTPNIGERKKGDLSHLRVHKFKMDNQLALLGYSWIEEKIEIQLSIIVTSKMASSSSLIPTFDAHMIKNSKPKDSKKP